MNDLEKDLTYLFNNVPLYTKESFQLFDKTDDDSYILNKVGFKTLTQYLGFGQSNIVSKCIECEHEFSFSKKIEIETFNSYNKLFTNSDNIRVSKYMNNFGKYSDLIIINKTELELDSFSHIYFEKECLKNDSYFIKYFFTCTHNSNHIYQMYLLLDIKEYIVKVTKIGQYPSILSIQGFDFDKYKKDLEKYDAYIDYKKADMSFTEAFFAGAYTYLRRIFEKQINYYIGKDELTDNRMETKIEHVKKKYNPDVQPLISSLYSILSIGIHQLSEQQCKEYYEYLKTIIDMQLQYEKNQREQSEQKVRLKSKIDEITKSFKK